MYQWPSLKLASAFIYPDCIRSPQDCHHSTASVVQDDLTHADSSPVLITMSIWCGRWSGTLLSVRDVSNDYQFCKHRLTGRRISGGQCYDITLLAICMAITRGTIILS